MHAARHIDRFGPFTLDRQRRRLSRDGRRVLLAGRQMGVLLELTREPGEVVSRDALLAAGWNEVAIGPDSLRKVITELRALCGPHAIKTHKRYGYQWTIPRDRGTNEVRSGGDPVETTDQGQDDGPPEWPDLDASPHASVLHGRRLLETLLRDGAIEAGEAFAGALTSDASLPLAHAGLAAALVLQYQATRADAVPARDLLVRAQRHASAAWQQAPDSGEAWAALALVLYCDGQADQAVTAARRSVTRAANEWQHHLVHAFVSSGAERLRAASRLLELSPQNPLGHWLAATVFVARQALAKALDHLRIGCAMQDYQRLHDGRRGWLRMAGMHLLNGQVLAALGDEAGAITALQRELAGEGTGQVYEREACANACYVLAALAFRAGDREGARAWCDRALARVAAHPLASLLAAAVGEGPIGRVGQVGGSTPIARAAQHVLLGQHEAAARGVIADLAVSAEPVPGWAWSLRIEPLLNVAAQPEAWAAALAFVHQRAS